jgi:hypothetical protein
MSVATCVGALAYLPDRPPTPPTLAAAGRTISGSPHADGTSHPTVGYLPGLPGSQHQPCVTIVLTDLAGWPATRFQEAPGVRSLLRSWRLLLTNWRFMKLCLAWAVPYGAIDPARPTPPRDNYRHVGSDQSGAPWRQASSRAGTRCSARTSRPSASASCRPAASAARRRWGGGEGRPKVRKMQPSNAGASSRISSYICLR